MEKHAKAKKRSWREDERVINRNLLPAWRHLKAKDIARRDVRQVVETVLERGAPIQANRVFAHLDLANGWWTIPAELAKNGHSHRVPLSGEALGVLSAVKRLGEPGPAVFRSPSKSGSMQYAQKAVERLRKASGVEFNGRHLRRTAASHMTSTT